MSAYGLHVLAQEVRAFVGFIRRTGIGIGGQAHFRIDDDMTVARQVYYHVGDESPSLFVGGGILNGEIAAFGEARHF